MLILLTKWIGKHWEIFAWTAVALMIWWCAVTIGHWRQAALQLPAAKAQVIEERKKKEEEIKSIRKEYQKLQAASEGYRNELEKVRNVAPLVPPVIRVCRPVPSSHSTASHSTGASSAAAGTGVLHEEAELDTRPLYDDAARCDALSAQLRQLIPLAQEGRQ